MPFRDIEGAVRCKIKKNEVLIKQGDYPQYIYYLIKGIIGRENINDNGDESIMAEKCASGSVKSLVGVLILYRMVDEELMPSHYTFVARTDCICYKIPVHAYITYAENNTMLLKQTVALALDEHANLRARLEERREGASAKMLGEFILSKAEVVDDELLLAKIYTNVEIAKFLGVHKVTVAKMLKRLKEENVLLRTSDGLVIKDVTSLKEYAQGKKLNYK